MLRPGQSTRLRRYLHAFGLAGVLWTIFKAGYVRHDLHEILATSSFALLTIVYAAPLWKEARHRLTRVGLVLFGGAVFCLAVNSAFPGWNPRVVEFFENTFLDTPQRFEVAIEWICGSPLTEYQRDDLKDPLANPVPHVDGTVDVYSWGQRSVIINGLDYDPRPVFHSYLTYTTALSRLNADLRSAKAPQNIFFQPQPLDNHYPSQEESLSWPELFTRYAPADATGSRLYLKKSEPARDYSILPIQHLTARWRVDRGPGRDGSDLGESRYRFNSRRPDRSRPVQTPDAASHDQNPLGRRRVVSPAHRRRGRRVFAFAANLGSALLRDGLFHSMEKSPLAI